MKISRQKIVAILIKEKSSKIIAHETYQKLRNGEDILLKTGAKLKIRIPSFR